MASKTDPLAGLDNIQPSGNGGQPFKLDRLLGDQPEQLERIRTAYLAGYSSNQLADRLTANGYKISDSAIQAWLKKEGVERV